jgi:Tetratricopeptide repeat
VLGEDDHETLTSAGNLAIALKNLGKYQAARDLDEDTLARRRRVLGDDHPDTLTSASNLAIDLRVLGRPMMACEVVVGCLGAVSSASVIRAGDCWSCPSFSQAGYPWRSGAGYRYGEADRMPGSQGGLDAMARSWT